MYEHARENLLKLKQEMLELMHSFEENGLMGNFQENTGELSMYDNFSADIASETFEREKDLGILDNIKIRLQNIEDALNRIEEGTYGICEYCGKPIDEARLEAMPETTLCFACKEHEEEQDPMTVRPKEERLLSTPFHRTFLDHGNNEAESVITDGEDVLQQLAQYGDANSPQDVGGASDYDSVYVDHDEDIGIVDDIERYIEGADHGYEQ